MPKPVLRRRGAVGKAAQPKEETAESRARKAVEDFEKEHALLAEMMEDFEARFPEASDAMKEIYKQQDVVREKISAAKPLVAEAKMSIGGFTCQNKKSTAKYDDVEFTSLVGLNKDSDLVLDLIQAGAVTKIVLSKSSIQWFAQHPDSAEKYKEAWKDSAPLPSAVTVPEI